MRTKNFILRELKEHNLYQYISQFKWFMWYFNTPYIEQLCGILKIYIRELPPNLKLLYEYGFEKPNDKLCIKNIKTPEKLEKYCIENGLCYEGFSVIKNIKEQIASNPNFALVLKPSGRITYANNISDNFYSKENHYYIVDEEHFYQKFDNFKRMVNNQFNQFLKLNNL